MVAGAVAACVLIAPASQADSATDTKSSAQVEAEFGGCESAGWCWCWFRIGTPDGFAQTVIRVRPEGIPRNAGNDASSVSVRNRLNALLSNMIHQAKHIVLHGLRELDDGTFAAAVTVTGVNLATDPILVELREHAARATR